MVLTFPSITTHKTTLKSTLADSRNGHFFQDLGVFAYSKYRLCFLIIAISIFSKFSEQNSKGEFKCRFCRGKIVTAHFFIWGRQSLFEFGQYIVFDLLIRNAQLFLDFCQYVLIMHLAVIPDYLMSEELISAEYSSFFRIQ